MSHQTIKETENAMDTVDTAKPENIKQPTKENKTVKPKTKKRRVFRLFILCLLTIIGVGIYFNLSHSAIYTPFPQETIDIDIHSSDTIPVNPNNIKITNAKQLEPVILPTQEAQPEEKANTSTEDPTKTEISISDATTETPVESKPSSITSESALNNPTDAAQIDTSTPEQKQPEIQTDKQSIPNTPSSMEAYSIQKALNFRDHFLSEQSCADDLRELILSEQKSEAIQQVIQDTSYFCLTTQNVYSELNDLFSRAKKQALIHSFHQNNPTWQAYLLTALTYMIQIRNLNPTGDTLADKLDRAQNALLNQQVARSAEIISTLPQETKQFFTVFLDKANNYTDAVSALDNLILSYAKGE